MTRTRRIAFATVALIAGLVAVPSVASARTFWRPAPVQHVEASSTYSARIELRMRDARARIAGALGTSRMNDAHRQQVMRDVDTGITLIRQRVALYGQDRVVNPWEQGQIDNLAKAIAADLTKTYGSIDSFMLL